MSSDEVLLFTSIMMISMRVTDEGLGAKRGIFPPFFVCLYQILRFNLLGKVPYDQPDISLI